MLLTKITCYNGNNTNCPATGVATPFSQITTFTQLNNGPQVQMDTSYDGYGQVTGTAEYDYAAITRTRQTTIEYGTYNFTSPGCTAMSNGIIDRPCRFAVTDGTGTTVVSKSMFAYDETAVTATTGSPNHVSVTGSRGNMTTSAVQANGSTTLYRKFTYYDTGTPKTSTDVSISGSTNGPTTTYSYAGTSCGNSFVTTVTLPLSLARSAGWSCTGGVMTSSTDENQKVAIFGYADPNFWRRTSVSFPDGGQTTTTYNTVSPPWNIQISSKLDATRNIVTKTVLDTLGRTVQSQLTSDPTGTVYTDTGYDALGRVASVSNPYRTTTDPTYGVTSYAYDALGRVTTVTEPGGKTVLMTYTKAATRVQDEGNGTRRITTIHQRDGLGRLTDVCEVTSATQLGITPTPAACGLDIAAAGFLTSYQYDTLGNLTGVDQGGLNPRSYSYDMLSRMTSETNPESGTTTYTYDTNSAGDLYQHVGPKPNQTNASIKVTATYTHDALHRLMFTSYDDGLTPRGRFRLRRSLGVGVHRGEPQGAAYAHQQRGGGHGLQLRRDGTIRRPVAVHALKLRHLSPALYL